MGNALLLAVLASSSPAGERVGAPPTVLVLPIAGLAGLPAEQAGLVTSALAAEMAASSGHKVLVFREVEDRFTAEQVQAASTCAAVRCAVALAAVVGADQVIVGEVGRLGEGSVLNVQRVDARRGEVVARGSASVDGPRVEGLLGELPRIARQLLGASRDDDDDDGDDGSRRRRGWDFGRVMALLMRIGGLTCCALVPVPMIAALAVGLVGAGTFGAISIATEEPDPFLIGGLSSLGAAAVMLLVVLVPLSLGVALFGGSFFVDRT